MTKKKRPFQNRCGSRFQSQVEATTGVEPVYAALQAAA
jgi:hypothetical protein